MYNDIEKFYDIVVIGAGPAGSTAARFAAEAGCKVLLLERDREPGIPVRCAEGVSHNGISQFILPDPRWICTKVSSARFHAPNGESCDLSFPGENSFGYILDRRVFDRSLADLAVSKGVRLLTKADAVGLLRDKNSDETKATKGVIFRHRKAIYQVQCSIVIGADGVESQVGRWAGIDTCLALDDIYSLAQYTVNNINIQNDICHFYLGKNYIPSGYIWVFPKSSSQANIGAGMCGNAIREGKSVLYYLDKFMHKNFPKASINCSIFGGEPSKAGHDFVKNNVMLVGDAAQQADPLTGAGIVQGMIGGKYCGETAAKALKTKDFSLLKEYPDKWENHLGKNQRFMYLLRNKTHKLLDRQLNKIMASIRKIPREELSLARIFRETVFDDPALVAKLATDFLIAKLKA
ncbi:MAG: NAD(P)/FAD-dependent oxidoreductase [Candidatus Cloacimonetes bacterium]|nr:NAD(P)/FAD-dependent oxidoreductase [Candidatus Cloacimonadota bacterium]